MNMVSVNFGTEFPAACLSIATSTGGQTSITKTSFTFNRLDEFAGTITTYYIALGY